MPATLAGTPIFLSLVSVPLVIYPTVLNIAIVVIGTVTAARITPSIANSLSMRDNFRPYLFR